LAILAASLRASRGAVMIAPLRRTHLRIWVALAILLPVLFVAAILSRQNTTPHNLEFHWERLP
jgi:hypothetical protein